MKNRVGFVAVALAVTLTSLVLPCFAFTLGDLRGNAVIGRSLDVSAQVQTGAGEDAAASCISAEVFHADVRQSTPAVTVTPAGAGASYSALVRVRSAALVDEPVVTLVLRSNCGSTTTRTYVLLADFQPAGQPLTPTTPPAQGTLAPLAAASVVLPVAGVLPQAADSPPGNENAVAAEKKLRPSKAAPVASGAVLALKPASTGRTAPDRPQRKAADRAPVKAVLKLDPLDILSDRIDSLDSVMLFAPTGDALKQSHDITALQGDVKSLRDTAARNDALLLELKLKMQQSESQQIPASWFYGLLAVLLLCLGALAWLGLRQRRDNLGTDTRSTSGKTWQDSVQEASPETVLMPRGGTSPAVGDPSVPFDDTLVVSRSPAGEPKLQDIDLDIDLDAFTQAGPGAVPEPPIEATVSGMGALHSISVETILDIRQQAEFFVSLGQTDRALRILKKQISDGSEPNPFIYLDLLTLLHSLGLKADFREYRTAFHRNFNGLVPDFPSFHFEGKGLLDYPDALAQLAQDWPQADALMFLDASIFRNPRLQSQLSYDLAAFRDLLMLHALLEAVSTDLPWNTTTSSDTASVLAPMATAGATPLEEPVAQPEVTLMPLPSEQTPANGTPLPESPSRMLDLDFSTLTAEDIHPDDLAVPPKLWPGATKT